LADKVLRLVLYRKETYRLPQACRKIQVLSGAAWVTVAGEDVILTQGEKTSFMPGKDVLISALGNAPLILEIHEK
jgi:quercetin dioxygenase-like cupin family protein